jgi:transcriptional regulator with XRE-family HTH domain
MRQLGVELRSMPSFGENLRTAMARTGLERDTLAAKLRVGETQVDKWLSVKANPRLDTLFRIATALNMSIEALINGVNDDYDAQRQHGAYRSRLLELCLLLTDDQCRALIPTAEIFLFGTPRAGSLPDEESP